MPDVRSLLRDLKTENPSSASFRSHCYNGLDSNEKQALAARDIQVYTGKVRDMVFHGSEVYVLHSDRLTAFDKLIAYIPYKGTLLTAISQFWFEKANPVMKTHYIDRPSERTLRVKRAEPVKVEVVVRGYLAGSMMRAYQHGERVFCGVTLPDGLKPYQRLPEPIITPTTKAAVFEHDENIAVKDLIARGIATSEEWEQIASGALKLFALGTEVLADHGWILVDTKYEFGRSSEGIVVIDEIHTPDSSRFWKQSSYQARLAADRAPDMLDKEIVRRWLAEHGFQGEGDVPDVPTEVLIGLGQVYLEVAETLTGHPVETTGPDYKAAF